jgi:hypothetical protein
MTPTTLKAFRSLLFYSPAEAAIFVGNVSEAIWTAYEEGELSVPEEVASRIEDLIQWREGKLSTAEQTFSRFKTVLPEEFELEMPVLVWYPTLDDWMTLPGREPVMWRPRCSVIAELCARYKATVVRFNGPAYAAWLAGRPDGETMRGIWAAEQSA